MQWKHTATVLILFSHCLKNYHLQYTATLLAVQWQQYQLTLNKSLCNFIENYFIFKLMQYFDACANDM